ncbi:hypothetical protein [Allokutzneria sp. NRRL B-24872]|uniref:hypothetical protein n=1 Tax=Allokutzneria sp. NRRL B-24872 TaxID=1137961 RepID=UPI000A3BD5AA|nr:hypothetical protein [Allokutzneria sp. NRRL B-24872]
MKITAIALATALLLFTGTAHAGVRQFQDGFEGSPATKWRAINHAGFDINLGNARTGQNNAWLHTDRALGNPAVDIEVATGTNGPSTCTARVYANALNNRSTEIDRVVVSDSEGHLYTTMHAWLTYGSGYEPITVNNINIQGYKTLRVRYELQDNNRGFDGEWVRLDDFTLQCAY